MDIRKFTKAHRRMQKIRNWLYEFADVKLMIAIVFFMVSMAIAFQRMIR